MCLISDTASARYADKDITCYKLVCTDKRNKRFRSLYKGFIYMPGACYFEGRFKKMDYSRHVSYGYHSYHTIKEALLHSAPGTVLLKCVIPKGSWYYTSQEHRQYCSNKIKVVAWKPLRYGKWKENLETNKAKL